MKLHSILADRNNGLTQSRVILSFFVLLDHQYALLQISKPKLLSGALTLSSFAVYMFIFMSGLLCFVSRARNSAPRFLLLRFARIFPGYAACLAISSLLFIPLLTAFANKGRVFSLSLAWATIRASADYFFGNLAFTQNVYLPSSMKIDHPIPAINGSLWTLQPEIMGYLLIAILFPLLCLVPRLLVILLGIGVICLAVMPAQLRTGMQPIVGGYGFEIGTDSHLYLAVYLLSGIIYAIYARQIDVNSRLGLLCLLLLAASYNVDIRAFNIISPLILPYVFICFCWIVRWPWGPGVDFSFGVYLYSFPIQQITWSLQESSLLGDSFPIGLLLVSAASFAFGMFSFYFVEHPFRLRILSLMPAMK